MSARRTLWLLILPPTLAFVGLGLAMANAFPASTPLAVGLGCLGLAALLGTWYWLDRRLLAPLGTIADAMQQVSLGKPAAEVPLPQGRLLAELEESLQLLFADLEQTRGEASRVRASGTVGLDDERQRLAVVLREIRDGVLVCDGDGQILLSNPAAERILGSASGLAPGQSVYAYWARAPVEHGLQMLQYRRQSTAEGGPGEQHEAFVCATLDQGQLLHCRMSLLPASATLHPGFLITFDDVTNKLEAVTRRDEILRQAIQRLRAPLASLRAAAENLARETTISPENRERFETMIARESRALSGCLDWMAEESQALLSTPWSMADVQTSDLIASTRLQPGFGAQLPQIREFGFPLWLHANSHAISALLGQLLWRLRDQHGAEQVDIEALLGDRRVYLDLRWRGPPLQSDTLERWLEEPLPDQPRELTGLDVLERHDSVCWSQWDSANPGCSVLRIPLPASRRQWQQPLSISNRREYHVPPPEGGHTQLGSLGQQPLDRLACVVFDTETTGVEPEHGDEIVWIAGVRVRNGRVLGSGVFDALVRPRRPIPAASSAIHGIRDADVASSAPIEDILPRFHQFTGQSVLVGHNADFDMQFIHMQEAACGVRFDRPVLDTLLLSMVLYPHTAEHSLEALAWRLGVTVNERHTAPGDAQLTAEIFVRLLPALRRNGIVTLQDALQASGRMVDVRRRQAPQQRESG